MLSEKSVVRWELEKYADILLRLLLLGLILLAFGRVLWQLDAKNLWWDESLSLQRAEENWLDLLRGRLLMQDGFRVVPTTDQHPFFFFLIQGILVRLAGTSEFVLRLPSVLAATLLAPTVWVIAQWLQRRHIMPPSAAYWAALLAAVNPFFLWYGQEARPYALWAWLALFSLYWLLRYTATPHPPRSQLVGYAVTLFLFLATHYYAVFWLPIHALLLYRWLAQRNWRWALVLALGLLSLGALIGTIVAWIIYSQGGGGNFPSITLAILIPDLLNAFSLGKSVNIDDVRWLDYLFGGVALLGAGWGLRSRQHSRLAGWLLPSCLVIPIGLLMAVNQIQPGYMDARHLSLIGGAFILLVGAGLGVLWQQQRWIAGAVALVLGYGILTSTVNYFTDPAYDKDHYTDMAEYLNANLQPGDLVLISPPFSWRIFDYYLPLDKVTQGSQAGRGTAHYGMPLLQADWEQTYQQLAAFQNQYRRIWLARSGTHPYLDPEGKVSDWLIKHSARQLDVYKAFSPTAFLDLELYLSKPPVFEGLNPPAEYSADLAYGDLFRLVGYDIGAPLTRDNAIPLTLYWQVRTKPSARYKVILQLVERLANGTLRVLGATEQEPYKGRIDTTLWDPGKTIIEYTQLPPVALAGQTGTSYLLTVQIYHAESEEKLPVVVHGAAAQQLDPQTGAVPFVPKIVP